MMHILAIDWAMVGIKVAQFILSLSILIILHELGHYITARWFGCRVEKFYLFFDPWFSLFKKKVGDTEYGIGWLPLGGYVKISGMIDESMDTEALKQEPQAWEFRSKPAWQRLIIMLGGIIMNVIVAILIYSMVLFVWGESKIPMSSLKYGVSFQDSLLLQVGFQNGDRIKSVDGKKIEYLEETALKIFMGKSAVVERNGTAVNLIFPEDLIGKLIENKKRNSGMLLPRTPAIIGPIQELSDPSPIKKAGALQGDRILAIDGQGLTYFDEIKPIVSASKNKTVQVQILRGIDTMMLTSTLTDEKRLGVLPILSEDTLVRLGLMQVITKKYGFAESFPAGFKRTGEKLGEYIDQFKKILSPKTGAYKGLGGFKAIANAFPAVWDWESFWSITALLSIILAFMNLLPIPALDGGHVMFTLYEMITRRKPNEKFLEYAQMAGMIFLLLLMVYANANDWLGWGK
ncbi:MAG: RIP metalloprotease RseP [Chitinophagaceae bacterium]